ncbi:MAG: hypothetical protein V2A64_03150 [Candidatus Omnitrophota bacterium]
MEKQQKQLMITAGLIVVLIAASINTFKKKAPVKKSSAAKVSSLESNPKLPQSPSAKAVSPVDEKASDPRVERAKLDWGRDPFKLSLDKEYQRSDLTLKGISFGKDKQGFAFINNDIVKKGDKVGDYDVLEVDKDKVLLKKGNQNFYLTLPEK